MMAILGWFITLLLSIYLSVGFILTIWFWVHIGGIFKTIEIFYLSCWLITNIGLWYWVVIDFPFNITIK